LYIHPVFKCLFSLVTTSGMGQFFGPISHLLGVKK